MLIRFGVENHASFHQPAELSLLATRFRDAPDHCFPAAGTAHGVLPVMAIYGANASGKTNLLRALWTLREEVVRSFADRKPDAPMLHRSFALDPAAATQPTLLDIDFLVEGVRYHYGVRYDARQVLQEWLYAWPEGRQQRWFFRERVAPSDGSALSPSASHLSGEYTYEFGSRFRGRKSLIADLTRANSLFLSAGAQHNHEQLLPLYRWFARGLQRPEGLSGTDVPLFEANASLLQPRYADVVRALLRRADIGVQDFRAREDAEAVERYRQRGGLLSADALRRFAQSPPLTIELAHESRTGEPVYLAPEQESHGTRMLLLHSERVLGVLAEGACLVVDELDASLHPRLSAALLALFTSESANPRGAQLLFTTHDESLLEHLRRDSVLFIEKDRTGNSSIIPLSDFQTRAHHNIRRGYAEGRFGGVPIVGDLAAAVGPTGES